MGGGGRREGGGRLGRWGGERENREGVEEGLGARVKKDKGGGGGVEEGKGGWGRCEVRKGREEEGGREAIGRGGTSGQGE